MCEIYVAQGTFTEKFLLKTLFKPRENGRGFVLVYRDRVKVLRDLNPEHATEQYMKHASRNTPLLSVLHLRVPTHGDVSLENTQPFASTRRVFAHNGMLSDDVYHLLLAMFPIEGASDSRLLWEVVKDLSWERAVDLLRSLRDRFVLVDVPKQRVALVGDWRFDQKVGVWDRGFLDYSFVLLSYRGGKLEILDTERSTRHTRRMSTITSPLSESSSFIR
jgi:hypothetical protein